MALKKSELDAIEALYKAEFEKARETRIRDLQTKNGARIAKIEKELEDIAARESALRDEQRKLGGDHIPSTGYWRGSETPGWVHLRAKVMFAADINDIQKAIAEAVAEAFAE